MNFEVSQLQESGVGLAAMIWYGNEQQGFGSGVNMIYLLSDSMNFAE